MDTGMAIEIMKALGIRRGILKKEGIIGRGGMMITIGETATDMRVEGTDHTRDEPSGEETATTETTVAGADLPLVSEPID